MNSNQILTSLSLIAALAATVGSRRYAILALSPDRAGTR